LVSGGGVSKTPQARDSVGGLGMRPIIGLAILLFGLEGGAPGGAPESKYEDRVPVAQESSISSTFKSEIAYADPESGASTAESRKPETETAQADPAETDAAAADTPENDAAENDPPTTAALGNNDNNRAAESSRGLVVASLEVESLGAGHDQGEEALRPAASPAIAVTNPATDPDTDTDEDATESVDTLCTAVLDSAQDNNLPVQFFANLIWQESELRRDSVSRVGALGIAQFMPSVAAEFGLADPYDPHQAIPASARLLHTLRQHFGNIGLAAAAYNAGAHRVGQWLDHHRPLPRETRNYVRRITGRPVEAWRKSPTDETKLAFMRPLPCRKMAAFAELEQLPPLEERDEPKAGRRGGGKFAQKGAKGTIASTQRLADRRAERRLTVPAAAIVRDTHGNHEAMRRHVPHERRRIAQAVMPAPTP
jgi:soluble lytic murein transglycosylase-like protein